MNTRYGRSDRIRTCGIDVPNVARYQLRHTPKCEKYSIFRSISVSGQICGQNILSVFFEKANSRKSQSFTYFRKRKSGFRAFGKPATENRLHAPKASALLFGVAKFLRTYLGILGCRKCGTLKYCMGIILSE